MKAAVFKMPKTIGVEDVPDPKIEQPTDVIVKITSTAICGSDLHIYNGLFPQLGTMILGHEFMGVIEEVGSNVRKLAPGDRVIVPFPIGCGECWFCRQNLTTHCENSNPKHYGPEGGTLSEKGGALYGYTDLYGGYDGGQAQYARALFADFNLRKVPDELTDDQVLFLTDIFPTGWAAVDWAEPKGGETIAVFGCGPVGIMAQKSAWLRGAKKVIGVDILPYRLEMARTIAGSEVINADDQNPVDAIRSMTDGHGADICVDAVGMEAHRSVLDKIKAAIDLERGTIDVLETAVSAVRRGGVISVVGVYGTSYDNFPFGQIFDKGLSLRSGQVMVQRYVDELLDLVKNGKVRLDDVITHRLPLTDVKKAYDIFNSKEEDCLKIVLKPWENGGR